MPSDKPRITIYTDETTIKKFDFIAKKDNRSKSGQLVHIIKNIIENYEKKNGTIELAELEEEPDKKTKL